VRTQQVRPDFIVNQIVTLRKAAQHKSVKIMRVAANKDEEIAKIEEIRSEVIR
jgi:hypothetical protein